MLLKLQKAQAHLKGHLVLYHQLKVKNKDNLRKRGCHKVCSTDSIFSFCNDEKEKEAKMGQQEEKKLHKCVHITLGHIEVDDI